MRELGWVYLHHACSYLDSNGFCSCQFTRSYGSRDDGSFSHSSLTFTLDPPHPFCFASTLAFSGSVLPSQQDAQGVRKIQARPIVLKCLHQMQSSPSHPARPHHRQQEKPTPHPQFPPLTLVAALRWKKCPLPRIFPLRSAATLKLTLQELNLQTTSLALVLAWWRQRFPPASKILP